MPPLDDKIAALAARDLPLAAREAKRRVASGDVQQSARFGIGAGIEQNTRRVGGSPALRRSSEHREPGRAPRGRTGRTTSLDR